LGWHLNDYAAVSAAIKRLDARLPIDKPCADLYRAAVKMLNVEMSPQ